MHLQTPNRADHGQGLSHFCWLKMGSFTSTLDRRRLPLWGPLDFDLLFMGVTIKKHRGSPMGSYQLWPCIAMFILSTLKARQALCEPSRQTWSVSLCPSHRWINPLVPPLGLSGPTWQMVVAYSSTMSRFYTLHFSTGSLPQFPNSRESVSFFSSTSVFFDINIPSVSGSHVGMHLNWHLGSCARVRLSASLAIHPLWDTTLPPSQAAHSLRPSRQSLF